MLRLTLIFNFGAKMKRFMIPFLAFFCAMPAFAVGGKLFIKNQVEGLEVNVVTDLLCHHYQDEANTPGSARYTSPLDENPIKYAAEPVEINWVNCVIAEEQFFAKTGNRDHSKFYVTITNPLTGEHKDHVFQVRSGDAQTQELKLGEKTVELSLSHFGEYVYSTGYPVVFQTETNLTLATK